MALLPDSPSGGGPYESGAPLYLSAGWPSILPLPPGTKWPPPEGFTGYHNVWTSGPDVYEWIADRGDSNVALRLPDGIIGIDVDAYAGKSGGASLELALDQWGPLPPTWRSTSRDDGVSGIYLFTTPTGLWWPSQVGPDIEIIRQGHRYAVVWPSMHPAGGRYRWIDHDGLSALTVPGRYDLPALPAAWVAGLSGGRMAGAETERRAVTGALLETLMDAGAMCRVVRHVVAEGCAEIGSGAVGSRHDAGARVLMHLFRLRSEGHAGLRSAVEIYWLSWSAAVLAPGTGQRASDHAEREWLDLVRGAAALVSGPTAPDPCADDLAGILSPGWQQHADWSPTPPSEGIPSAGPDTSADPIGSLTDGDAGADGTVGLDQYRAQLVHVEAERLRVRLEARALVDAERHRAWEPPATGTLAALLANPLPPLRWVIADLLPVAGNVLLAAQFKAGKTTLVNHFAQCLVDGLPFLDVHGIDASEHRVALWNYEVGGDQYLHWLADLHVKNADRIHVANLRGHSVPFLTEKIEDWVVGWMIERGITDWIVDPFARAFVGNGDNENLNSEVSLFVDGLDRIKDRAGINTLILPAHTGRAISDVGAERVRGATRLDDWCDVRWILTTQPDDEGVSRRYFRATGRDVELAEAEIIMDPITRRLRSVAGARERTTPGRSTTRGAPRRNVSNELMLAVADHPGTSQRGLRELLGGRGQTVSDALAGLVSQGLIRAESGPGRGAPTVYYISERKSS